MINDMFWNVRGVSKAPTVRRLKKLIQIHKIQFLAICEPCLEVGRAERYRCRLKFHSLLHNSMGTIWFFIQENFSGSIIGESPQHVSIRLSHDHIPGSRVVVPFVHARCTADERIELWADLLRDNPGPDAWLVGGDFNVILEIDE